MSTQTYSCSIQLTNFVPNVLKKVPNPPSNISRVCILSNRNLPFLTRFNKKFSNSPYFLARDELISGIVCSSQSNAHTNTEPESDEYTYEFQDDGDCVEVRISIPSELQNFNSEQLGMNIHDDSLLVTISTMDNIFPLLVAKPLYSLIKSSESVWYKEDEEIVLNLKKRNPEMVWPQLVRTLVSLGNGVSKLLNNCSIYIVGENSNLNFEIAQQIASVTGYVPLQTKQLIESITKKSVTQIHEEEGNAGVQEIESQIIESLSTNVRCCVGTLGESFGTAQSKNNWNHLHAAITVCLSPSPSQTDKHDSFSQADIQVNFVKNEKYSSEEIKTMAENVLIKLKSVLELDSELPNKKLLYVRMGCNGDWLNLKNQKKDDIKSSNSNLIKNVVL